jgi:D-galactarolactone cycloisomerase
MSKVERIELYHVNIPLDAPFRPSWIPGYPMTHNRFTLARIFTDDGLEGVAAGAAFAREREGLGDLIGGYLIGVDAADMVTVRQRLREASYLGWRNWWLENAFWDLRGKMEGKPVYKLLQEREHTVERAPVYASTGEVRSFEGRQAYLDEIRARGIGAVKIRVKDPARRDDGTILRQVREYLGDDYVLAADANQGWPVSLFDRTPHWDLAYATEFGAACDDLGIAWIEEPLDMHDWDGMVALRDAVKTPIAGGELHGDWHELRALLERGCLDKYQPDATFSGLSTAVKVMAECRRRGLQYSPHTWTNGIGLLVNLHAFAAWEQRDLLEYPFEPPGWTPNRRDGLIPDIAVAPDGTIAVPQDPGLGIQLQKGWLKIFGKRFFVATPMRVAVKVIKEKGIRTAMELKKRKV